MSKFNEGSGYAKDLNPVSILKVGMAEKHITLASVLIASLDIPFKRVFVLFDNHTCAFEFNKYFSTLVCLKDVVYKQRDLCYTGANKSSIKIGFGNNLQYVRSNYGGLSFHSIIIIDVEDLPTKRFLVSRLRGYEENIGYSLFEGSIHNLIEINITI